MVGDLHVWCNDRGTKNANPCKKSSATTLILEYWDRLLFIVSDDEERPVGSRWGRTMARSRGSLPHESEELYLV